MRFGTRLEVNLDNLQSNLQLLKTSYLKGQEVIFMVKANAYGHGLIPITNFASDELGIKEFGVATLGEALALYNANPGFTGKIIIFSDHGLDSAIFRKHYESSSMIPVISQLSDLKIFFESPIFRKFPLYLKLNTGMNRLGIDSDQVDTVIKLIKDSGRSRIDHLMSHFACSYLKRSKSPLTNQQYETFEQLKSEFRGAGITIDQSSMANSAAIESGIALNESHVRPGLMLYGPTSLMYRHNSPWQGKVISNLSTKIISKRDVSKGDVVGYGASYIPEDGSIIVIGIGYGDGWSTHMKNIEYQYGDHLGTSLGRVNMDMTTVFFKKIASTNFKIGDEVLLWGDTQDRILELSSKSGSIAYELFCNLSVRLPRKYVLK